MACCSGKTNTAAKSKIIIAIHGQYPSGDAASELQAITLYAELGTLLAMQIYTGINELKLDEFLMLSYFLCHAFPIYHSMMGKINLPSDIVQSLPIEKHLKL
ncbi:unnamed protein product [Echinostoma caproni]|uniref:Metacaspase-1-like n=1 Tax=Echinostoma caproni TaxID=27848 RepID=A0A183AB42_9TREM|nr:unnamed protein product [Echinostoma caproni]